MDVASTGEYLIVPAGNDELVAASSDDLGHIVLLARNTDRPKTWFLEELGNGAATLTLKEGPTAFAKGTVEGDELRVVAGAEKVIWKVVADYPAVAIETSHFKEHGVLRWQVSSDPQSGETIKLRNRPPLNNLSTTHWRFIPAN